MKRIIYFLIHAGLLYPGSLMMAGNKYSHHPPVNFTEIKADTTFRNLTVVQADSLIDSNVFNPDFRIIDVRTPSEYGSGHLEHAVNINFNAADFDASLDTLDKTKVYLIYCQSGGRSGQTFTKMRAKHFVVVYNMLGGFSAWLAGGYPYVTNTTGIEDETTVSAGVNVYPNPASQYFYIETSDISPENTLVETFNHTGERVTTEHFNYGNKIRIDAGKLIPGIYFYRLTRQAMPVSIGKILIIK